MKPKRREIDYLIATVERQIERCRPKLPVDAIAEYEQALETYRRWGETLND